MSKNKRQIIIYLLLVLGLSNIFWYLAYSNQESGYAMVLVVISSFLPMILALTITKISKQGWDGLGIAFHLKDSWRIYLLAIFGTVILVYLSDPLMLLLFPEQVSTKFSTGRISEIVLMTLLGTACFIECLGEELGWIGYLFPLLEQESGTIAACVTLGLVRGAYHIGILVLMEYPVQMFLELTISNLFLSFFMVYLNKKSRSLFPCTIHHGISNLLPILLVYENQWYYTSILPMVICMIPAVIFGGYGIWMMRKRDMFVRRGRKPGMSGENC